MKCFLWLAVLGLGSVAHAMPTEGLTTLAGAPASSQRVKPIELVVIWASWCPDCREKLGSELVEINARPDVAVTTVNVDRDRKRAQSFVESERVALPVLRDETRAFRAKLGAFAVPHWAVYARPKQNAQGSWTLIDSAGAFEHDRVQAALARAEAQSRTN